MYSHRICISVCRVYRRLDSMSGIRWHPNTPYHRHKAAGLDSRLGHPVESVYVPNRHRPGFGQHWGHLGVVPYVVSVCTIRTAFPRIAGWSAGVAVNMTTRCAPSARSRVEVARDRRLTATIRINGCHEIHNCDQNNHMCEHVMTGRLVHYDGLGRIRQTGIQCHTCHQNFVKINLVTLSWNVIILDHHSANQAQPWGFCNLSKYSFHLKLWNIVEGFVYKLVWGDNQIRLIKAW